MKNTEIIYDYSLLRGRILQKYKSQKDFAISVVGITPTALARIMTNKNRFSQDMISKIADVLEIDPSLIGSYFFTRKSQKSAWYEKTINHYWRYQ